MQSSLSAAFIPKVEQHQKKKKKILQVSEQQTEKIKMKYKQIYFFL